ncbi:MAG: phenylalanine--tRNA ligase subunit alpha, partial [Helicobacter sp.]|nr:phenylalanine--tRNA ligase subunit alpha [Helicobacter sp.]
MEQLETFRIHIIGKKGKLTTYFSALRDLDEVSKKSVAQKLNALKSTFETLYEEKKQILTTLELNAKLEQEYIDVSLFNTLHSRSFGHPITQVLDRIIDYFVNMSFSIQSGPLVEDDFHNFEALNLPKFHPARDMQDTFYFKDSFLLRTHTSPVQIRTMESHSLPIRVIFCLVCFATCLSMNR